MINLPVIPNAADIITTDDADWLDHLSENIIAIIIEALYNINQTRIRMYWNIGREIIQEEQRQKAEYEQDPTRDPPVSRAYIFRNIGDRIARYEGLIGTGKTALYDATNFAKMCPDEESLQRTLARLDRQKSLSWGYICKQLLPGHESNGNVWHPAILYSGLAILARLHGPHGQLWTVELPPEIKLEAKAGNTIHVILKETTQ